MKQATVRPLWSAPAMIASNLMIGRRVEKNQGKNELSVQSKYILLSPWTVR